MKIDPTTSQAARPQIQEPAGQGAGNKRAGTTGEPQARADTQEDRVQLSEEGRSRAGGTRGEHGNSPAWRARDMMSEYESLRGLRFGQLVSSLARGEDPLTRFAAPDSTPETPAPGPSPTSPAAPAELTGVTISPANPEPAETTAPTLTVVLPETPDPAEEPPV
jgi:hypothetical protein